jgi:hypothetical protein
MKIRSTMMAAALATAILGVSPAVSAQEPTIEQVKAIIEAARAEMRASREALLAANLEMTPAESDKFWPLYRDYNTKRASLGDERLKIIMDYAEVYPAVSDAVARNLVDRSIKNSKADEKLQYEYIGKIGKVLPAAKLMRFMQIESRIDNLVELKIQQSIPVVEPGAQ